MKSAVVRFLRLAQQVVTPNQIADIYDTEVRRRIILPRARSRELLKNDKPSQHGSKNGYQNGIPILDLAFYGLSDALNFFRKMRFFQNRLFQELPRSSSDQ